MVGGSEKGTVTGKPASNEYKLIKFTFIYFSCKHIPLIEPLTILTNNAQDTTFSNKGYNRSKKGDVDEDMWSHR